MTSTDWGHLFVVFLSAISNFALIQFIEVPENYLIFIVFIISGLTAFR